MADRRVSTPNAQSESSHEDGAFSAIPVARSFTSVSANMNSVKPQSRQTREFRNAKTVGVVRLLTSGKWMFISTGNVLWFSERHTLQDIA